VIAGRQRLLVAGFLWIASCAATQLPTTSLRLRGARHDALVTIDEQYVGKFAMVARRGVALPPGRHRVSVERPGYFPHDVIVDVSPGQAPIVVQVNLEPIPE
jgi:hypothetical protein